MEKQVAFLTRNLLMGGAFSHLSIGEAIRLEKLLMNKPEVDQSEQLMQFWYAGNYFSLQMPQHLLHECNLLLLHAGKPMIDVFVADVYEA